MSDLVAVQREAARADHLRLITEFARYEKKVGGPDPQLATIAGIGTPSRQEHIWRALLYGSVYNVPTTEILWKYWTPELVLEHPADLRGWIAQNWSGLAFRRERRAVRTPKKLQEYMEGAAVWADSWRARRWLDEPASYETAWRDVQEVKYLGRYVALKVIEYMVRYAGAQVELEDIRPKGGWSPRLSLVLLYPNHGYEIMRDDKHGERLSNELAGGLLGHMHDEGVDLSWFELQVILCEYRECYMSRRQYPGRSHDSELAYGRKLEEHWGRGLGMWDSRADQFPHVSLGEMMGWRGPREVLGGVLREHGYIWSDLVFRYDYSLDLSKPVRWDDGSIGADGAAVARSDVPGEDVARSA